MTDWVTWRVSPRPDGRWEAAQDGAMHTASVFERKSDAVALARGRARAATIGTMVVHRRDGTLQATRRYGRRPRVVDLIGIGDSGGSDVAQHKDEYLAEAIAADLR